MTVSDYSMRWLPKSIVLATGVALGVFIWYTYFARVSHLYPLAFQQSLWLVASDEGPQGYFRQEIYISSRIQQAWIMVAATDSFVIYLNGKALHGIGYASLNVSAIYDVGAYLIPGKNVLGVAARRISYPGPAMAAIEGGYRDHTGREHMLATDASWKFSSVEQTQGDGEILWYSADFDATAWAPVKTGGRPEPSAIYPLGVHPFVFTMSPQGQWIGYSSAPQDRPTFSQTLHLPGQPTDGWLRITAAQSYSGTVNGVPLQGEPSQTLPPLGTDGASTWKPDIRQSTDVYDIRPLLRAGSNRITVSSEVMPSVDGLFVDGFVIHGSRLLTFGSDATWAINVPLHTSNGNMPEHPHATVLATNEALPVKNVMRTILPLNYQVIQAGKMSLTILILVVSIYVLWRGTSRLASRLMGSDATESANMDALLHLPPLLLLGGLYLLTFDVRFDPAFAFQPYAVWAAIILLVVFKGLVILEILLHRRRPSRDLSLSPAEQARAAIPVYAVLLCCLIAAGAYLRLLDLNAQSLYHDEAHMVGYVQGLFEKGYPYKMIGPIERPLATYELVPYPIALSAKLLGFSDFALRFPAALFGILTIPLIAFVGTRVFDRRVGLLAAAIYTFCPQALIWAKYLWHPQQTQFFALLTSYFFFQAIRGETLSAKYIYLAAVAFSVTYLSWEGAGFFLPALGLALLVVKGKDLAWLRDRHLWMATGLISIVVVLQLIRRTLLQIVYLVVGQGLSDVSLPTFFFLDPMYDSTFYVQNFLWLENNIPLTLLACGGLLFFWRKHGLSYYCTLLLSILLMMTTLLTNAAIRYVYYVQPFLILSASAVTFFLLDTIVSSIRSIQFRTIRLIYCMFSLSFLTFLTLTSSFYMKTYRLTDFYSSGGFHIKEDVYYIDYRGTSEYLKSMYQQDDLVISLVPNTISYYSNISSDFFFQFYTMRQVVYDPTESSDRYLERTIGIPVIRNTGELMEVLSSYRRIWVIATPYRIFVKLSGPEIREYVRRKGQVTYETYNSKVYLILN
jgi:Dolichyl-phosphate-mannose-protein mannosyltransferase